MARRLTDGTLIERFIKKVRQDGFGCWEWTAFKDKAGYSKFWWAESRFAHRFAYHYFNGPIPNGLTIDHVCRNNGCVNPGHLEAVTMRENVLRGAGIAGINASKTNCKCGKRFTTTPWNKRQRYCKPCAYKWHRNTINKNKQYYLDYYKRYRQTKRDNAKTSQ